MVFVAITTLTYTYIYIHTGEEVERPQLVNCTIMLLSNSFCSHAFVLPPPAGPSPDGGRACLPAVRPRRRVCSAGHGPLSLCPRGRAVCLPGRGDPVLGGEAEEEEGWQILAACQQGGAGRKRC